MSGLVLRLAAGPIERVSADVAVVPLFAGERPLRDTAGRIDWRLCGRLSHLFAARRLDGASGEAVLVPGGGGVRARLVLGLGLGERPAVADLREPASPADSTSPSSASSRSASSRSASSGWERWPAWCGDALARARALDARHVALGVPGFGPALPERLAELLAAAGETEGTFDLALELAPEPADRAEAAEWLRRASQRGAPGGALVQRPAEARVPRGEASPNPPGRSSRGTAGRFTR